MLALAAVVLATAVQANPTVTFDTSMGTFTAELFLDRVPRTGASAALLNRLMQHACVSLLLLNLYRVHPPCHQPPTS